MARHSKANSDVVDPRRIAAKRELYRRNFERFGAEQLYIKPRQAGPLVTLKLDTAQQLLNSKVEADFGRRGYCRIVTLKGRQSGWSTYGQARLFHSATLHENYDTLLVALDESNTRSIFDMAHLFYKQMDDDIKPQIKYSTKRELVFANPDRRTQSDHPGLNSRMNFQSSTNVLAGTGITRQALHASECAKWHPEHIRDLITSLLPAIHPVPGTLVILESTAFSGGDYFREMCEDAREGGGEYIWCFVPWWLNCQHTTPLLKGEKIEPTQEEKSLMKLASKGQPNDDVPPHDITPEQIKWYRAMYHALGDEGEFEQEYPRSFKSAWQSRDLHVFDFEILRKMEREVRNPERIVNVNGSADKKPVVTTVAKGERIDSEREYIALWEEPQEGVVYDVGVDVAAGVEGGDWSVAEVIRRDNGEQVAEYHRHIDPVDLAEDIYWLGKYYNTAQVIVEMNTYGLSTGNHLARLAYPYIYTWRQWDRSVPKLSNYAGWKTTYESKKMLVGNGRHLFLHGRMMVHSKVLHNEMQQFIRINEDNYRAAHGWDDCCMAYLIGVQGGYDESFGVPLNSVIEERKRSNILTPHLSDPRAGKVDTTSRVAETIIRDFQGMS